MSSYPWLIFSGIGLFDLAVERRMLVVNVRHQRVAPFA